jgi:hypothetical protein
MKARKLHWSVPDDWMNRECDGVGYGRAHKGARAGAHGQTLFVLFKRDVARLENDILLIPHLY